MLVYLVCASVLCTLCHLILIKMYVSLTYVCPLGDVILCSIRTLLKKVGCSCVCLSFGLIALHLSLYVTNRVLIRFTYVLYFVVVAFSACLQMAPSSPKKKTPAKKANKRMKMDPNLFRSISHFERYKNFFLKAGIIQERFVDLEDLRHIYP